MVFKDINSLFTHKQLIVYMAYKELTDRYAGSTLGLIWAIIQPLFLVGFYALIFTYIFKVNISTDSSSLEYALYAIIGLIPWLAMAEGLTRSITAITSKSSLVKQAIFPIGILPVSTLLASFVSLIVGLTIYLTIMFIFLPGQTSLFMLLLPLVIFFHFLFSLGIAYFLAIAGVYFRDLTELATIILTVGIFVTPILYLEGSIPYPFQIAMQFNLAAHLIYIYRDVLFYGQINHPLSFVVFPLSATVFFIFGSYSFQKIKHLFANAL